MVGENSGIEFRDTVRILGGGCLLPEYGEQVKFGAEMFVTIVE